METQFKGKVEQKEVVVGPELTTLLEKIQYQNTIAYESLTSIKEKLYALHRYHDDNTQTVSEERKAPQSALEQLSEELDRMLHNNNKLRDIELHLSMIL